MNDEFRRQPITPGELGVTGLAAVEQAALLEQLRPGRAPPPSSDGFAALTMASTESVVMSA